MSTNITPCCPIKPYRHEAHGDIREDPYFWLRDKKNPEVLKYLQQENDYADQVYRDTSMDQLKDTCYKEFLARIKETDETAPFKDSSYLYYERTVEGQDYNIYCRKKILQGSMEDISSLETAEEQILLDVNQIAADLDYCDIGHFLVSPCHGKIAYTLDTEGDEQYSLQILDLATSPPSYIHRNLLCDITSQIEWSQDGNFIFYARMDDALRPYQLYQHRIGSSVEEDRLLFEETDERFHLAFEKTHDSRFILLYLESQITTEAHIMPSDKPELDLRVVIPRRDGVEYNIETHNESVFLMTNYNDQKNFTVMRASIPSIESNSKQPLLEDPAENEESWTTIIPHSRDVMVSNVIPFKNFLTIKQRHEGLPRIQVVPLGSEGEVKEGDSHFIDFPEASYSCRYQDNAEFDTDLLRIKYSSYLTPATIYDYNMKSRSLILRKQKEVQGGYDPSQYIIERINAPAEDGTQIPISLVRKKDLPIDGSAKCLLNGYGSYGDAYDTSFSHEIFSLLDRNFVYATAHVRGGGEKGRYWYEQGKLLNKRNTFDDFASCAKHLIDAKYTSAKNQAVYGASAGGLLIGAVLNMHGSKLFSVAVASVPFVDVVTSMLDETLPLTAIEWEEWGNPKEKKFYEYMKSYSPYDNIAPQAYPHMLIRAGLNDSRVHFSEPTKFCAKLRTLKTDDNLLLLKTNTEAGHFGSSGRYDYLQEDAYEYAFIINQLDSRHTKE